jgi:hypothetical protein
MENSEAPPFQTCARTYTENSVNKAYTIWENYYLNKADYLNELEEALQDPELAERTRGGAARS